MGFKDIHLLASELADTAEHDDSVRARTTPAEYAELTKIVRKCDACGFWTSVAELANLNGDELCPVCVELEVHQD